MMPKVIQLLYDLSMYSCCYDERDLDLYTKVGVVQHLIRGIGGITEKHNCVAYLDGMEFILSRDPVVYDMLLKYAKYQHLKRAWAEKELKAQRPPAIPESQINELKELFDVESPVFNEMVALCDLDNFCVKR